MPHIFPNPNKFLHYKKFISYKYTIIPLYIKVTDGRNLYSANIKFYFPLSKVKLTFDGSFGERAYYFNPDLLTIYNQNQTQRTTISARGEVVISKSIKLIASYQYAKFDAFNINYFIIGLKFSL